MMAGWPSLSKRYNVGMKTILKREVRERITILNLKATGLALR
jgi:hypothetical protein